MIRCKSNQKDLSTKRGLLHNLGTPDRIRTYGLRLRKPTLYPAELRVLTAPLL